MTRMGKDLGWTRVQTVRLECRTAIREILNIRVIRGKKCRWMRRGTGRPGPLIHPWSVLRHRRINLLGPRGNPALDVVELAESSLLQQAHRLRAAAAGFAMDDDLIRAIQLAHARGQLSKRDQLSLVEMADVPLERLAHVD